MRYDDLSAVVLHVRPYRETSVMVQFFTREQGRIAGVMKGVRRGRNPVSIQPFNQGILGCIGRQSLMTVTRFDVEARFKLAGRELSAGFYILELLSRCLAEQQIEPKVFDASMRTLHELENLGVSSSSLMAVHLRMFERELLSELGYGFDYGTDALTGEPVASELCYSWRAQGGFSVESQERETGPGDSADVGGIQGWMLIAMAEGQYADPKVLRLAKRLHQKALAPLLGSAPLISRSMYLRDAKNSTHQRG